MTGELYGRILIDDNDKKRIEEAIEVMKEVDWEYSKLGLESVKFLIEDLRDGVSALKGILEGLYY